MIVTDGDKIYYLLGHDDEWAMLEYEGDHIYQSIANIRELLPGQQIAYMSLKGDKIENGFVEKVNHESRNVYCRYFNRDHILRTRANPEHTLIWNLRIHHWATQDFIDKTIAELKGG